MKSEAGVTAVEYAMVAMLIALVIAAAVKQIAPKLNIVFNSVANTLQSPPPEGR